MYLYVFATILTMQTHPQALESCDFTDVRPLFPPLMHTICLVYSNSEYYNTTARIIVLMQVCTSYMASILNVTDSAYYPCFRCCNVILCSLWNVV